VGRARAAGQKEWWEDFVQDEAAYTDEFRENDVLREDDWEVPLDSAGGASASTHGAPFRPGPTQPGGLNPGATLWSGPTAAPARGAGGGGGAHAGYEGYGEEESPGGDEYWEGWDAEGGYQGGEAFARLAAAFPSYSAPALAEVLDLTGGDDAAAHALISNLEQQAQALAARQRQAVAARSRARPPPPQAGDFPALGVAMAGAPPAHLGDTMPDSWRTDAPPAPVSAPLMPRAAPSMATGPARPWGTSFADMASRPAPAPPPSAPAGPRPSGQPVPPWMMSGMPGAGRPVRPPDPPAQWVETGRAVAVHYEKERQKAKELASQRNRLYDAAQNAYKQGDGAAAKSLSDQARAIEQQMFQAHREAATALFGKRNAGWAATRVHHAPVEIPPTLDLHGLHVAEAREILGSELPAAQAMGLRGITLLVGTQHHTQGRHSEGLAAGVQGFLQEVGWKWQESEPGAVYVYLQGGF